MTGSTDLWRALEAVRTGNPCHVVASGYTRSTWEEHARVLAEALAAAEADRDAWRTKALRHAQDSAEKGHRLHDAEATIARVRAAAERWESGGRAQRPLVLMGKALHRHLAGTETKGTP